VDSTGVLFFTKHNPPTASKGSGASIVYANPEESIADFLLPIVICIPAIM
jgi:hypothetical protein